jgi:hypothetical protein
VCADDRGDAAVLAMDFAAGNTNQKVRRPKYLAERESVAVRILAG